MGVIIAQMEAGEGINASVSTKQINLAGLATVENTDVSYQDTVESGNTLVIPDIDITKNDDSVVTSPAAIDLDLRIIDPFPATWDELVAEYGRGYAYPIHSGHQTSYRTGDDKYIEDNVFTVAVRSANSLKPINSLTNDFLTLNNTNAFGNLLRFTDSVGGIDFDGTGGSLLDYVIDHYTGIGWGRKIRTIGTEDWNTVIDNNLGSDFGGSGTDAAYLGFTNWFTPYENHLRSIDGRNITLGGNANFKYFPFMIGASPVINEFSASDYRLISSTVHSATSSSIRVFRVAVESMSTEAKTSLNERVICRKHF